MWAGVWCKPMLESGNKAPVGLADGQLPTWPAGQEELISIPSLGLALQPAAELALELSNSSRTTFYSNWIWVLILRNKKITTSNVYESIWDFYGPVGNVIEMKEEYRVVSEFLCWNCILVKLILNNCIYWGPTGGKTHFMYAFQYVCFYFFSGKRQNQSHWSDLNVYKGK